MNVISAQSSSRQSVPNADATMRIAKSKSILHLLLVPVAVLLTCLVLRPDQPVVALAIGGCLALVVALCALLLLRTASTACALSHSLDEQLLQSRKMAAIGEMSSGIAHEINTPLGIITQELEWLHHVLGTPDLAPLAAHPDVKDSLAQIENQVKRCSEITHGMLNFARKMHTVGQSTDINRLLEDMVIWVEREATVNNIRIIRNYAPDLPEITSDAPMLRTIILNLLHNAAQALQKDGEIVVATRTFGPEGIEFSVTDNGPGIAPEHLESIFNPFFTTKEPGKGTGLGLSICLATVTRLGGVISVQSEPGKGACFSVRLPLVPPGKSKES